MGATMTKSERFKLRRLRLMADATLINIETEESEHAKIAKARPAPQQQEGSGGKPTQVQIGSR